MHLVPVILAGGKGERFWPLSRRDRPKQFLRLDGSGRSLLQATAMRVLPLGGGYENLWVVTAAHLVKGVFAHLPELRKENLLVEPEGRDTAAAVAWATLEIKERYGEDVVIGIFPADAWIKDEDAFHATLEQAAFLATARDLLVTLGIAPSHPSTGYGYIEQGQSIGEMPGFLVKRFTEKPDLKTAEAFVQSGRFSWNSGIFVFRPRVMLSELKLYLPELPALLLAEGKAAYARLPKISLDYAVMEKTASAAVLPAMFGWDDLGDWTALERLLRDENPNVEVGKHLCLETSGSVFYTTSGDDLIVTIGLEDVVIVRDGNATLVVKKDRVQDIKKVLKLLNEDPELQRWV